MSGGESVAHGAGRSRGLRRTWSGGSRGVTVLALAVASGCSYRPARFALAPPVERADDERAVAMPKPRTFFPTFFEADVYVRRELVNMLDPKRTPAAVDVNQLDDVVASSWYSPPRLADKPLKGYTRNGPPVPPFTAIDEPPSSETPGVRVVIDARGIRYELLSDLAGRRGMRTGAAATASRLAFALGYETPEVHVTTTPDGERVAATQWPVGVDLGPTSIAHTRADDPNDRLDPRDRRSLRALRLVGAWLDFKRFAPRMLRDAYAGKPGEGHVRHYLVGLDGALGVDRYRDAVQWVLDKDREDSNFFLRLFSLGLSPKPAAYMPETPWPSVGLYEEFATPSEYSPSPPFEPGDRLLPADAYWAAKRIAAVSQRILGRAVISSHLGAPEQNWLLQLLAARRAQVVAWGFDRTTPLEVATLATSVNEAGAGVLELVDLAIDSGVAKARHMSYAVRFLASDGSELERRDDLRPEKARLSVALPSAAAAHDYVVVHVRGYRRGRPLPNAFEAHLRQGPLGFRLVGVRH